MKEEREPTPMRAQKNPSPSPPYSCRSASIGLSRAAFHAGKNPNAIPTVAENTRAITRMSTDTVNGIPSARVVAYDPPNPRSMPKRPPIAESVTASIRNCNSTSRPRADGQADADLACSLGHRDQHGVQDLDAANEQAHPGDGAEQRRERAAHRRIASFNPC